MSEVRCLVAIVTVFLACAADGATLSETERQLTEVVDSRQREAMALLEQAVEINSGSMNLAGVKQVGQLFRDAFANLAFEVSWVNGAAFERAGHLVARHRGSGPHLLLIGHLDTVFEADSPFQRFERLDAERAKGPGIIDMKGGNVIIVEALTALKAVGAVAELQITVVMIGDEESTGHPLSEARRVLLEAADDADVALGFEDGAGNPETAVIARRGYTGWRLTVAGTPAHS
ncbi:MAG: M20/M25/M40 family metallo-hydrolase, partial [Woeseiaceae bacterium]